MRTHSRIGMLMGTHSIRMPVSFPLALTHLYTYSLTIRDLSQFVHTQSNTLKTHMLTQSLSLIHIQK